MSNLEAAPPEVECTGGGTVGQLIEPRAVPLGGPRAMPVRRTLPQRARSLVGAWCFADHYGPDDVSTTGGMHVAGHPHTGLQTVSWLFTGEIEHRDTTGVHALVRPSELNLMTAGSGIAHSEYSTPETTTLHGAQLWIALPAGSRFTAPSFEHYAPPVLDLDGVRALVFLGSLAGARSPVTTFSPLLGAELTLPEGHRIELDVDPAFEHAFLVDRGELTVGGLTAQPGRLLYLPPGTRRLSLRSDPGARVLLLGGEPLGEQIVMWWNFLGRDHDEIAEFRADWERARTGTPGRFGDFPASWSETLPAPELPHARLKPRT